MRFLKYRKLPHRLAGREGFEPSNARSKAWCLTSLATAQRSDLPGSMVNPNRACAAECTQYQRRTGDLPPSGVSFDPQYLARSVDKRRSGSAFDFEASNLPSIP